MKIGGVEKIRGGRAATWCIEEGLRWRKENLIFVHDKLHESRNWRLRTIGKKKKGKTTKQGLQANITPYIKAALKKKQGENRGINGVRGGK